MRRSILILVLLLALTESFLVNPPGGLAQGVVYSDSMDSAATGLFSEASPDPAQYRYAYENGSFIMEAIPSDYAGEFYAVAAVPDLLGSEVEVDTAILGETTGRYVFIGCRAGESDDGYLFELQVDTGDVRLWRMDPGAPTVIAEANAADVVNLGNGSNRIGIECISQILTGSVNGVPVLSEFDPTYASGSTYIGAGVYADSPGPVFASFDNFVALDRGNVQFVDAPTVTPAGDALGQEVPIRDPTVDPDGALSDAFTVSMNLPPAVSGLGESFDVPLGIVTKLGADVQLTDFYAEFYFATPSIPANTTFLAGFCFWTDPSGNCYDVYLEDNGTGVSGWGHGYDTKDGVYELLSSGGLPPGAIDPTPGAVNFLGLMVYQGVAILSGSNFDATMVIPLQGAPTAGSVQAEFGFLDQGSSGADAITAELTDFSVWDLSSGMVPVELDSSAVATEETAVMAPTTAPELAAGPVLPPLQSATGNEALFDQNRTAIVQNPPLVAGSAGSFTETDGVYAYTNAGLNLTNVYTIATFTNPTELSAPFDIGIGIRDNRDSQGGLRFVISSDGTLTMLTPGMDPLASGAANGFVAAPGATNTIEILAQGSSAIVAINGVLTTEIDIITIPNSGDVYLGAGFYMGETVTGRVIPYSDWWVFPIDPADFPAS